MKTYYKVVLPNLCSCVFGCALVNDLRFCVQYKVGKYVKPRIKGTDLMIFDSLRNVNKFISKNYSHWNSVVVFEAHAKHVRKKGVFVSCLGAELDAIMINKMIKFKKKKKKYLYLSDEAPIGTLFAKEVKLVKLVS